MGRKPTVGQFETRQRLETKVLYLYHNTACSLQRVADHCGVSWGVANEIIVRRGLEAPERQDDGNQS